MSVASSAFRARPATKSSTANKGHGLEALTDRSRRPVRYANQLPPQIEQLIVACKRDKPHWGARKDTRTPGPAAGRRHPRSCKKHDPCRLAPARLGQGRWTGAASRCWHAALTRNGAQRPMVRRLQGRVQTRQRAVLLSLDGHRSSIAFPASLRSP